MDEKKQPIEAPSQDEQLELFFYHFKHNFYRAEQVYKRLSKKKGNFSFKLELNKEKGGKVSYNVPDEQTAKEFAVSMSRFLLPDSSLNIDNLLRTLQQLSTDTEYQDFLINVNQCLNKVKEGQFPVIMNNKQLRADDVFVELSSNVLFANDIDAAKYLDKLRNDPITGNLKWSLYYGYCLDVFKILSIIIDYLEKHDIHPPRIDRKNHCIFCKTTDGNFSSVEHVIPESIGNETLFLPRGYVCDNCNTRISKLEQDFVNSLPISMVKIFFGSVGKKGKLPSAKFSNVHLQRISPNAITMRYHVGAKSIPKATELPEGGYKLKLSLTTQFNPHIIARVLFKMGLGIVATDRGREEALHPRYDPAREYILNGGHFPNRLAIFKESHPSNVSKIEGAINNKEGTFIHFELLGARFIIGLEPNPKNMINEQLLDQAYVFDLWKDKPEPLHGSVKRTS
ncbi:HNH endonuclease [Candidatus Methanophagaceae archaeon]|nr:HNH endonuclease [Methanophagales archaeon]